MKRILFFVGCLLVSLLMTSCLEAGMDEPVNSSDKEMTAVTYSYRFLYNDTIKKGTVNEDIQIGRVCDVVFKKQTEPIDGDNVKGFKTTLTYDINCVQKSGPSGSVTKQMLYDMFKERITKEGLTNLWVYVSISDAATVSPLNGSPIFGCPGDFSTDRTYRVVAADGSYEDYVIKTVKGF